ncbi:MAG: 4Fe-4S dicluster domain-containing protein [candidate division Zixibacteria bacterium]|nr:4Fe-4S dicluster domain-containing protein [candidate division Zixibacteria bacterium]
MEITREIFWNVGTWARWPVYGLGLIVVVIFVLGLAKRIRLWRIGKPENRYDRIGKRIWSFVSSGLLHRRILKEAYPGITHLFLFWGFLILLLGTILIFIQEDITALLFNTTFIQGSFYLVFSFLLDLFGLLAIIGVILLAFRRYALRPDRLDNKPEDLITLILVFLVLLTGFFSEGIRIAVTRPDFERYSFVGWEISKLFGPSEAGAADMRPLHGVFWWIHLLLAFGFIGYVAYSRLLHLITSPLNQFFKSFAPAGEVKPILDIENQESFGVAKLEEFTWKQLLDADACTRCGRCQDNCPAYLSGKPLSPKKLIQDLKNHLSAQAKTLNRGEGKEEGVAPIAGKVISEDELWACTTCGACHQACPVLIEVIDKAVDLRRYLVLMESKFSPEVKLFFKNMETNYNPWTIGFSTRGDWAKDLSLKTLSDKSDIEYLLFAGCAGSFDERNRKVTRSLVTLLQKANVNFGILGVEEMCCGETARRMGNEYLAQILMQQNVELFGKYGVERIITICPHCFNTFKNEYHQFHGNYQVFHHTEFLWNLITEGKLKTNTGMETVVAYHDSCYLGRHNNLYDVPRKLLGSIKNAKPVEMELNRQKSFCCGAGGGRMWMEETIGTRINHMRVDQIASTDASVVATACPYCLTMLEDGVKEKGLESKFKVLDLAQLLEKAL